MAALETAAATVLAELVSVFTLLRLRLVVMALDVPTETWGLAEALADVAVTGLARIFVLHTREGMAACKREVAARGVSDIGHFLEVEVLL